MELTIKYQFVHGLGDGIYWAHGFIGDYKLESFFSDTSYVDAREKLVAYAKKIPPVPPDETINIDK